MGKGEELLYICVAALRPLKWAFIWLSDNCEATDPMSCWQT